MKRTASKKSHKKAQTPAKMYSPEDTLGSYTGVAEGDLVPTQDADDL